MNPDGIKQVTEGEVRAFAEALNIEVYREGPGSGMWWAAYPHIEGRLTLGQTNYLAYQRLVVEKERREAEAQKELKKQPPVHVGLFYSGSYDWVGLYRNGELVYEGHELEPETLLSKLGYEYEKREGSDTLEEYGGRCPKDWEDVRAVPDAS